MSMARSGLTLFSNLFHGGLFTTSGSEASSARPTVLERAPSEHLFDDGMPETVRRADRMSTAPSCDPGARGEVIGTRGGKPIVRLSYEGPDPDSLPTLDADSVAPAAGHSAPLSTPQIIERILQINASVTADYLASFGPAKLRVYLDRLQVMRQPRDHRSRWVRPSGEPAISSHEVQ